MQIITYLGNDDYYKKLHKQFEEKGGKWGEVPPGWRPITVEEFARSSFFQENWLGVDYRQFKADPTDKAISGVKLFVMHDYTGYGIVNDYWEKTIRYFRFGCDHKVRELTQAECRERGIYHAGKCFHVTQCQSCGHVSSYDSSD